MIDDTFEPTHSLEAMHSYEDDGYDYDDYGESADYPDYIDYANPDVGFDDMDYSMHDADYGDFGYGELDDEDYQYDTGYLGDYDEPEDDDPYGELGDLMQEDPAEAMRLTAELATQQALQAMEPVARNFAIQQMTHGLPADAGKYVNDFVAQHNVDPRLLSDPTVAQLIRDAAHGHALRSGASQFAIATPEFEGGTGVTSPFYEPDVRGQLSGLSGLAQSLGIQNYNPAETYRKVNG